MSQCADCLGRQGYEIAIHYTLHTLEGIYMSGSGGGGFTPVFDSCDTLVINTQLSSPKPEVVQHISVGDELIVALQAGETTTVVVALFQGQVAGGLAAPEIGRLRTCLEGGTEYRASVTAKSDGQVRVRVSAK